MDQPIVLWVDDERQLREIGKEMLKREGILCETAGSVEEALALIEKNPGKYKAVIVDIGIPGRSGLELIDCIKEAIGFIIVSGAKCSREMIERRPAVKATLLKPFRIGELTATINKVIQ